jgi:hypothetical protein
MWRGTLLFVSLRAGAGRVFFFLKKKEAKKTLFVWVRAG